MKESIGGTWIFTIVIVFIVLFTSFLAISVNYSKAFKVKNGIIELIEKNEGHSSNAEEDIGNYLSGVGYVTYGKCPTEAKGFYRKTGQDKYLYCVSKTKTVLNHLDATYYQVNVFFRLDLPILGDIFTFPVTGETKPIYYAKDNINEYIN